MKIARRSNWRLRRRLDGRTESVSNQIHQEKNVLYTIIYYYVLLSIIMYYSILLYIIVYYLYYYMIIYDYI